MEDFTKNDQIRNSIEAILGKKSHTILQGEMGITAKISVNGAVSHRQLMNLMALGIVEVVRASANVAITLLVPRNILRPEDIEIKIQSYSHRRMVVNKSTGQFGFVHLAQGDKLEIFYPYPIGQIVREKDEDLDFCALDGKEFQYTNKP